MQGSTDSVPQAPSFTLETPMEACDRAMPPAVASRGCQTSQPDSHPLLLAPAAAPPPSPPLAREHPLPDSPTLASLPTARCGAIVSESSTAVTLPDTAGAIEGSPLSCAETPAIRVSSSMVPFAARTHASDGASAIVSERLQAQVHRESSGSRGGSGVVGDGNGPVAASHLVAGLLLQRLPETVLLVKQLDWTARKMEIALNVLSGN
jgi:hypothetical protein